ncbi:MAG: VOC family protein [Gammaproteobacteria bacterium]|nr:VOC family protein [Gammaproteobacteria bacterium]
MLRLEHINIFVKDISASLKFYQAAMPHWFIRCEGQGEWFGTPRKWIHFGDDYTYLAISDNGSGVNRDLSSNAVGLAHFAFEITDMDALKNRLCAAGFEPDDNGSDEPFRKNVYYIDPDGFEVEFVEYLSDVPAQRNFSR